MMMKFLDQKTDEPEIEIIGRGVIDKMMEIEFDDVNVTMKRRNRIY